MERAAPGFARTVASIALVAVVFVVTGLLGLSLAIPPTAVTAVWLPSGIALSALLLAGRAVWPGVALGTLVTVALVLGRDGVPWPATVTVAVVTALGATAEALVGAIVIERFAAGRRALETSRTVAVLFMTTLAVCTIGATAGIAVLAASGQVPASALATTWVTWWLADVGGIVLVAPILLSFQERRGTRLRPADLVVLAIAALGLAQLVMGWPLHQTGVTISSYLALPLVVFAAVRVGARGVALAVFGIYAVMLWATMRGHGPFSSDTIHGALLQLDGYLVAIAATGLVLAASVRERDTASQALREVAERQRVERELRESEARLRTVIENLPFDFWACDRSGRYIIQNSTAIRHWGDQRGKKPEDLGLPPDVLVRWQNNNARALDGEVVRGRMRYCYDGVEGTFDEMLAPIRVDDQIVGFLGLNIDVTEIERLAGELIRAQRLEATGRLAGGIAHDFNNLLTVVIATAASLERRAVDAATVEAARRILQAGHRAADLTRQLLAFAGKQRVSPVVRRIDALVDEARELLRPVLPATIELVIEHEQPDVAIAIDPTQFSQVLVNLAMNARDAMEDGGTLTIHSARIQLDPRDAAALRVAPGRFVRLQVQDTGTGIATDVLPRVLEPFFTTKPFGQGSGLGLASVHGIATQAGGAIELHSTPGAGTSAVVYFPEATAASRTVETPSSSQEAARGETILLVEDQSLVRRAVASVLVETGYRVIEASDGEDALRAIGDHTGAFDLVLTDVVMPRMGGAHLVRHLRERGLAIPVIYMSGYTDGNAELPEGRCLAKPFSGNDLTRAVREALDAGSTPPVETSSDS